VADRAPSGRDPLVPALRSRSVECALVLLLAVVAVAAAAVGPMYERAVEQASVQSSLRASTPAQRTVRIDAARPAEARHYQPRGAAARLFGPPVVSRTLTLQLPGFSDPRFSGYIGTAVDRAGACGRLTIAAGRCFGAAAGEALVSAAAAASLHLRPGARIPADLVAGLGAHPVGDLVVVGTYRVPDPRDAYWQGDRFARTGLTAVDNGDLPAKLAVDPFFVGDATVTAAATAFGAQTGQPAVIPTRVQLHLVTGRVGADDVATLRSAISAAQARIAAGHPVGSPERGSLTTDLPRLLDEADRGRDSARRIVPSFAAQLAVLLVVLVGTVIAGGVERRRRDLALARLRGRSRSAAARWAVTDLAGVLAASLLPGWALAWLVDRALISATLPAYGIGPEWRWPVLLAGVGMVAVAGLVLYGAAHRAARAPLPELMRTVAPPATRRVSVAEAAVAVIALAGVVVVLTGGRHTALALVTPTLLALLAGLLLARGGAAVASAVGRRAIWRRRTGLGLVALNAARSAGLRRVVVLTCVAVALVVSTVDQWSVARTNRQARAEVEVGAPVVLTLGSANVPAIRHAVAAVDPAGRYAVPVVVRRPPGSGLPVVAADGEGLRRIAGWGRGNRPAAATLARLTPAHAPAAIAATGTTVAVQVAGVSVTADLGVTPRPRPVSLRLYFRAPAGFLTDTTVPLPTSARPARASAPLTGCEHGCTLTRIEIVRANADFSQAHIAIRLQRVLVGGQALRLGVAADWQDVNAAQAAAGQAPGIAFGDSDSGLVLRSTNDGSVPAIVQHLDVPVTPPCLVAGRPAAAESGANGLSVQGLDGRTITCRPVGVVPFAPRVGARAAVVDLGIAAGVADGSTDDATAMVFLRAGAPARERALRAALHRAGVTVTGRETVAARRAALDRSAPAESIEVALAVAAAAAGVAALMILVLAGSARRARRADLAALRLLGIGDRALRRTLLAEQLGVVLAGAAAGFGIGLAGAGLAVDALPMFVTSAQVPALVYPTAWGAVGVALAAAVVVLAVAGGLAAALLARRADGTVRE
jgi:hypothetical protein